ncbi:hypothetical protein KIN20_009183 [Parelaphostrongylus tenuis]|uniref:Uncharacterized protein n=1 Tax=Parelaphostrongylus tenuis TaxID=148309 RepID=A0AAD5MS90_PARTN|nr:hypothetical protein KIN20_009183 [Parelaphostrongylus tenuis]
MDVLVPQPAVTRIGCEIIGRYSQTSVSLEKKSMDEDGCERNEYEVFWGYRILKNLKRRRFESYDEVEEACKEFLIRSRIRLVPNLSVRWRKAVENDGLYCEE